MANDPKDPRAPQGDNEANAAIPAPPTTQGTEPTPATAAAQPIGVNAPVQTTGLVPDRPVPIPEEMMTPDHLQPAPLAPDDPRGMRYSPFAGNQRVMRSGLAIRDDISAVQMSGQASRDVSAQHISRLLYRPIDSAATPIYQSERMQRQLQPA